MFVEYYRPGTKEQTEDGITKTVTLPVKVPDGLERMVSADYFEAFRLPDNSGHTIYVKGRNGEIVVMEKETGGDSATADQPLYVRAYRRFFSRPTKKSEEATDTLYDELSNLLYSGFSSNVRRESHAVDEAAFMQAVATNRFDNLREVYTAK